MMYLYMDFSDGTDMTCSHLICKDGQEYVEVHFERPMPHGFDSARCRIPEYTWLFNDGFSEEEIATFTEIIKLVEKDLLEQVQKDNDWNAQEAVRLDRLTQDYLHMLELEVLSYQDRARVAKAIKDCRMQRQCAKDLVATTQPMVDFLTGERGKMMISQMQQVLGKVRKEENFIAQRIYTPKVLSREDLEALNR